MTMLCLAPSATVKIFEHLVDILVNTSMPSHWLNSVAWPVCRVPKFRNNPDWKQQYPEHDNNPFTSPCAYLCQRRNFHHHPSLFDIMDFKNQRHGWQQEGKKKAIGLISKTTTLRVHHTFLYISVPFLHDYDVKMPYFAFMEDVNKQRRNFISLSELGYGHLKFSFRRVCPHLTK